MVRLRAEAPPPPRPWENAAEVHFRLYKNRINMARSYDSALVAITQLILRESAKESGGTQFVTEDDQDSIATADGKLYVHKIPHLPLSKHKYFVVVMYPPDDLDDDDPPMVSDQPIKFLYSFYNLYLAGISLDDIWRIFNDAMIVGISQESRDMYVKDLPFPGNYGSISQNYLKLDVGFWGQCDTYNKIVGVRNNTTSDEQLKTALCRTIITLPESARFPFLAQYHLTNFHAGKFNVVLDKEVIQGEQYKNNSYHLTKWGTYSAMSKRGKELFKISDIPTSGIKSFSELLNFIGLATNKMYDEENNLLDCVVAEANKSGDDQADDNGGTEDQNNANEDSVDENKNAQGNEETWFYQAPVRPYVPHRRQNLNLDNEADVAACAIIEANRKTHLQEIGWMRSLQLAMLDACKYAEEQLSVKYFVEVGATAARCLRKEDSCHAARATGGTRVTTYADMEGEETFDPSFLGHGDEVVEERISDDEMIRVKGRKKTSAVSTVITGANDFMLDGIASPLHDALCIVKRSLDSKMIAARIGAVEATLSVYLENQSATPGSGEQLAAAERAGRLGKVRDELTLEAPSESSPGTAKSALAGCTSRPSCRPSVLAANLDAKWARIPYADGAWENLVRHDRFLLGRLGFVT